jgi:hypothetical protein
MITSVALILKRMKETKKEVQAFVAGRWMEYIPSRNADITLDEWYETLCRTFPRMKFRLVECKIRVIKES